MAVFPVAAWTRIAGARLAATALLSLACACGPPGPIRIGWRFVDGRTCASSGSADVRVTGPLACAPCVFLCTAGESGTVALTPTASGTITVDAESENGTALYRGSLDDGAGSPTVVTLYFLQ